MSLTPPTTGLLAVALVATTVAVPMAAGGSASAACQEAVTFQISDHKRVFAKVKGTQIRFSRPGTHTVEIVKASTLTARYNTDLIEDRRAIRKAVQKKWPVRHQVAVTPGHRTRFSTGAGERVTVVYASRGDRVNWQKVAVDDDCSTTVLDSGWAKFPRRNLDWLFAVAIS